MRNNPFLNTRLKIAILNRHKLVKVVAKETGIGYSQLSHLISGRRRPTKEQKRILSKYLKTTQKSIFPSNHPYMPKGLSVRRYIISGLGIQKKLNLE
jgi:hypothetical protein